MLLATCVAAAVRAAEVIRSGAAHLHAVRWETKGPADFVTATAMVPLPKPETINVWRYTTGVTMFCS